MRYADTLGKSFLGGSSRNCQGHKARVCVWSYTGAREGREIGDESKKIPKSLEMLGRTACFKDFGFSSA